MFIGREAELAALNSLHASGRFEFLVLYGRRRVGKTALISRLIQDKKAIYFMGVESSAGQNLENLSRSILEYTAGIQARTSFYSFQEALEYVFQLAETERLILSIDEYPYAARACPSLASTLQLLIDRYSAHSRLMLILCGSSMSYMEDQVLAYKAPLYGRRTAQLKLQPLDFADTCQYFQNCTPEEQALFYGITGGTPQYLLQMDGQRSIADNIRHTFLNPVSPLFEEPENLLKQEVRQPAAYNAVIRAIAGGATRLSEIATKTAESTSTCTACLKNLMGLGIVQRETPYGEKGSRRTIYSVQDSMFRFWYRFVPDNAALIVRGASGLVWQRVEPQLPAFMGKVFEEICRQYLWKLLLQGCCPVAFQDLGRWWGTDPVSHRQEEIDLMGQQDRDTALFAECKWTNEPADTAVLERLAARSRLFPYRHVHLFLFSKSGFTAGCVQAAADMGSVSLIPYDELHRFLTGGIRQQL